jgi:hypothetical protein
MVQHRAYWRLRVDAVMNLQRNEHKLNKEPVVMQIFVSPLHNEIMQKHLCSIHIVYSYAEHMRPYCTRGTYVTV